MSSPRPHTPPPSALNAPVRVSLGLSCGHTLPPAGPIPGIDAVTPGRVVICEQCSEYVITTRVTLTLDIDHLGRPGLTALFDDAVGDPVTAASLAADVLSGDRPGRRRETPGRR